MYSVLPSERRSFTTVLQCENGAFTADRYDADRVERLETHAPSSSQTLEERKMFNRIAKSKMFTGILAAAAVLMLVAMNLAIAAPTYAQGPTLASRPDPRKDARERQFKREQTWFNDQTNRLATAKTIATKTQN